MSSPTRNDTRDSRDDRYYKNDRRSRESSPKKTIFVGGLTRRVGESDLRNAFEKYGKVVKIDMKMGFAFVEYEDDRNCEEAIKQLHKTKLGDEYIRVEYSRGPRPRERRPTMHSEYRVIVDNLSPSVSWQELKDHMRRAGDVLYADVIKDSSGRSKGYGIVEFRSYEDMKDAIRRLNDTRLGSNYIYIKEVLFNFFIWPWTHFYISVRSGFLLSSVL